MRPLLERDRGGEIDPSFVITPPAAARRRAARRTRCSTTRTTSASRSCSIPPHERRPARATRRDRGRRRGARGGRGVRHRAALGADLDRTVLRHRRLAGARPADRAELLRAGGARRRSARAIADELDRAPRAARRSRGRGARDPVRRVASREDVERMVRQVTEQLGPIDVGHQQRRHDPGRARPTSWSSRTSRRRWTSTSGGRCTRCLAVLPEMRQRGAGRIVNVASIGGKISVPHLLPYSASKFALVGLSEGLRAELAKDGIQVTTVCPGLMRTGSPRHRPVQGAASRRVRVVQHQRLAAARLDERASARRGRSSTPCGTEPRSGSSRCRPGWRWRCTGSSRA